MERGPNIGPLFVARQQVRCRTGDGAGGELDGGLRTERIAACGGGAAVRAEDRVWLNGSATGGAARRCGVGGAAEDLGGDVSGLLGVVAADAAGGEEGIDEAEDGGDASPAEQQVEDAETVAAQVEVVDPKASKEDGEEDADDLVAASVLVLGVEPGALVVGHVCGVDVDGLHGNILQGAERRYAEELQEVPMDRRVGRIAALVGSAVQWNRQSCSATESVAIYSPGRPE